MSKCVLQPLLNSLVLAALTGGVISLSQAQPQTNGMQTGEALFEVLTSEIALQRGEASLAFNTYLEMARQYKDPRLAQRAMEITITGGSPDLAMQTAKVWDDLSAASDTKPKEILVTLLILSNRWPEAVKPTITLLYQQTPPQQENTLLQLQALLAKAKNESEALRAFYEIASTVKITSKNPSLLYTYAMSAEKVGRIDVMEKSLREILRKNPNDVNALNALGYSLADRNIKLSEAFALITKAHQLSPKDGFILDSLGWVNFRLGKNALALGQLQQAYAIKPEADIAAHAGEVLWVMDRRPKAQEMWRKGQKLNANNPTLKETLLRLKPDWTRENSVAKGAWDGRFAVKITGLTDTKNQGGSGEFSLTQEALKDVLEIRNPMGGSIAKITIMPGEATLESDGKVVAAIDADTLVQNTLGLPLPARGLSNWLKGEVRAGSEASIDQNSQGQVSKISQDGWDLIYTWSNTNCLERLTMTRNSNIGSINIRLFFDRPND
ncbi:outer membrane lipoprotein LolB [Polynucleobacter necessarius]|uniref:outer membrane lipoprotein LolB n=1 Tax=Polynucleobacter necessarius TaxID=576610 RepID=UPI000E09D03C|nr:outer membrane lipoprotein LolB [Polynucleobacter necessarius]HAT39520.1 hypothetical protein [Polynucleobacter sp.]